MTMLPRSVEKWRCCPSCDTTEPFNSAVRRWPEFFVALALSLVEAPAEISIPVANKVAAKLQAIRAEIFFCIIRIFAGGQDRESPPRSEAGCTCSDLSASVHVGPLACGHLTRLCPLQQDRATH